MKRITASIVAMDRITELEFVGALERTGSMEVTEYHEELITKGLLGKKPDLLEEYSFDSLLRAARDFVNGIWQALKALWHMLSWSVIIIVSAVRWLWKKGAGEKREKRG